MKRFSLLLVIAFVLFGYTSKSQFQVDAEIRPRFEYRQGFKSLYPDNSSPANFVSQRSRLSTKYTKESTTVFMSVQNIRVWGDVSQLNSADVNGLAIHEAYAKIGLLKNLSLKAGRQEIALDDHRIMGSVNWAQQARSHDAAVVQFYSDSLTLQAGLAYNQNGENLLGSAYTVPKNYKALQYLWLHKDWKKLSASVLVLNNGLQYIDTSAAAQHSVRYSQTIGTHLRYKSGKFSISGNIYYQTGVDVSLNDLNAYLIGVDAGYQLGSRLNLGLGGEIQSGNDNGAISNSTNNAFSPFYGTNHKFNGLMDYFYVGNHGNNVGLVDLNLNTKIKLSDKSKLMIAFHNFSTAAKLPVNGQANLGNEIDLVVVHKVSKSIIFKAGYSQVFAADGMEELKGNSDNNTNNWAWAMLVVKPNIFTSSK